MCLLKSARENNLFADDIPSYLIFRNIWFFMAIFTSALE